MVILLVGGAFFGVRTYGSVSGALAAAGRAAGRLSLGKSNYSQLGQANNTGLGPVPLNRTTSGSYQSSGSSESKGMKSSYGSAGAVAAGLGKMKISSDQAAARLSGASASSPMGARSPILGPKGGYGAV